MTNLRSHDHIIKIVFFNYEFYQINNCLKSEILVIESLNNRRNLSNKNILAKKKSLNKNFLI